MLSNSPGSNVIRCVPGGSIRTARAVSSNQASPTGTSRRVPRRGLARARVVLRDDEKDRAVLTTVDDDALEMADSPVCQIEHVDLAEGAAAKAIEVCRRGVRQPGGVAATLAREHSVHSALQRRPPFISTGSEASRTWKRVCLSAGLCAR
jgi:hypothetical protein